MLNQKLAQEHANKCEKRVGGLFKKYGLSVAKLDKDTKRKKPDYLVINRFGKQAIVECKFVASGGLTLDRKCHYSTLDPDLPNYGVFSPDSFEKYRVVLEQARQQYRELLKSDPKYSNTPFVVEIEADLFADGFNFVPKDIYGKKEISAIMKIEHDIELRRYLKKYSLEELEAVINKELDVYMPPESVRFRVLLNSASRNRFRPEDFLRNPIVL